MSENDTLENIIDITLGGKPSKEEKEHLSSCENWAKYAFVHNDIYYMIIYEYEEPVAYICYTDMHITIDFLDYYNDELVVHLTLVYHRFNLLIYHETDKKYTYKNDNLFLGQILSYTFNENRKTITEIAFADCGEATVIFTEIFPAKKDCNTVEKDVDVNVSHNYIRPPKNYRDFEYLLDYKNNIKPEYFDLPSQIKQ